MITTTPDHAKPDGIPSGETTPFRAVRHSSGRLVAGATIAVFLLMANGLLSFRNSRHLQEDNLWVAHSYQVTVGLERILSLMKDAETGERGYLITGEEAYLDPYALARREIESQVNKVESLTSDNPTHQARFAELRAHIRTRLDLLEENIGRRRQGDFETALAVMKGGAGKAEMDTLRGLIAGMLSHEAFLIEQRQSRSLLTFRTVLSSGILSSVAAVAAILALLLAIRRHLTARELSESSLAEQGERLRTTLASIGDGVITTDTLGRVTHLNAVAEDLTKWSNPQAKGRPLDEVFRIVNETTRLTVESPVTKALRDGAVIGLANHTVLLARDGSERAIDDSASPIRCALGEIVGCVLVFRDITERRRTEKDLVTSEARKSAILASGLDAIVGMDHAGRIEDWNPAAERIFGFTRAEVLGLQVADTIIPEEFREAHRRGLAHYLASGEGPVLDKRLELVARHADGRLFPCELAITATTIEGSPPFFTAYLRDITDRKFAEQTQTERAEVLLRADRSKDEFLAMLAHELRNPLAPMRNAAEILRAPEADIAARSLAQGILGRQIDNMTRMIDDLLDISRITQGKIELRLESVALDEILSSATALVRPGLAAQNQTLETHLPDAPVYLTADATRLEQVFNNLLGNACKYSGRGSRISLSAELAPAADPPGVIVRVSDNGTGIDPELLPRVFDLFVQSSRTLDRAHGGLGIGLTLVQRLVELHGGSVEARSAGLGAGSEFTVHLPVLAVCPGISARNSTPARAGRSLRILIVDDNKDSAESLSLLLELSGHRTRVAHNGPDALAAAAEFLPEATMLDIGLPGMNGFEIARRLREIPGLEKIFLVAMTGYGSEEDRQRSREAGFDEHLVKPADLDLLRALLGELR